LGGTVKSPFQCPLHPFFVSLERQAGPHYPPSLFTFPPLRSPTMLPHQFGYVLGRSLHASALLDPPPPPINCCRLKAQFFHLPLHRQTRSKGSTPTCTISSENPPKVRFPSRSLKQEIPPWLPGLQSKLRVNLFGNSPISHPHEGTIRLPMIFILSLSHVFDVLLQWLPVKACLTAFFSCSFGGNI